MALPCPVQQISFPSRKLISNFINEWLKLCLGQFLDGEWEAEILARKILHLAREMSLHYC
jgi:hypothetical protein